MKLLRMVMGAVLATVLLSACKEAALTGPVAGAQIHVDLLEQPGAGYQRQDSRTRGDYIDDQGLDAWLALDRAGRLLHVGKFEVDRELILDDTLYFVTARFGDDTDADGNGEYDQSPTEVMGEWHAIIPSALMRECGIRVSAMTDAAYEYVKADIGIIGDAALLAKLDEFAALVVSDVNGDGSINYRDVLEFSRVYSPESYLGSLAFLDGLIAAITADSIDHVRRAAAESVWLNEEVDPVQPFQVERTILGGVYAGDLVVSRDNSPYKLVGTLRVGGDLEIEPGVQIDGGGNQIIVSGDLIMEGLPRQLTLLEDTNVLVESWGDSNGTYIRYATFDDATMVFKIQGLELTESELSESSLEIRNSAAKGDMSALIARNIMYETDVTFYNRAPVRDAFMLSFINNLFVPDEDNESILETRWNADVTNLLVRNNSFHSNMRLLRDGASAEMDARENHWVEAPGVDLDFEAIIPDNETFAIRHFPWSKRAHPDTPELR